MTTVGMCRQPAPAPSGSSGPYDEEDVLPVSLLAEWARDRVLKQLGVGGNATPEEHQAYNHAMAIYGGKQDWPPSLRERHAAKRAADLGFPEAAVGLEDLDDDTLFVTAEETA